MNHQGEEQKQVGIQFFQFALETYLVDSTHKCNFEGWNKR
jgi:hypothetical protein